MSVLDHAVQPRPVQLQAGTTPGWFKTSSYLENTNRKSYTRPAWFGTVANGWLDVVGWM